MSKKLEGQVAVVTGASKGIRAGSARQLAAEGAPDVANHASGKADSDKVVADVTAAGGQAVAVMGGVSKVGPVDMKLEVVMIGVTDVDRAKAFYENLGWRFDDDFTAGDDFRIVQMTPHNSGASVIFGKGIRSAQPGLADSLVLAVDDLDAARDDLIARGVAVSAVFHYAGGPFNNTGENPRVGGRDPEGRTYFSFASFEDPDGNGWLLQEVKTRLPGREWESKRARATDVATLAELLRETAERHGRYEKTHAGHHWSDWYAPYLGARQNGSSPEEADTAADHHMAEVLHVLPR